VIGVAGRYPGSGEGVDGFFASLLAEEDLPRQVPHQRWDMEHYFSPEAQGHLSMYVRMASVINGLDEFDATLFRFVPNTKTMVTVAESQ
jgi:acyl transferase domain-containing protein